MSPPATCVPAPLTDGVVTLRAYRPGDVEATLEQCRDPDVQAWTDVPAPYRREHAEDFVLRMVPRGWSRGTYLCLAIEVDGACVGTVNLQPDGRGQAEVGYGLAADVRGRGYAARAVRLIAAWGTTSLGLVSILWRARVGNWPSRRVAWAAGFTVEGLVRDLLVGRTGRHDGWVGTLRPDDAMAPAHPWYEAVRLGGPLAGLRPLRLEDVVAVAQACADPLTQQWLPALPAPYTVTDALRYVAGREEEHAAGHGITWAVAGPDDDLAGVISLSGMGGPAPRTADVGYWAHPAARGRGLITDAVRSAARHALTDTDDGGLGLERIRLRAARENHTSRAVARRAGFTEVGIERDGERLRDGEPTDFVVHDLLPRDLPALP